MSSMVINDGQTLFDLALEIYGDSSKVFKLIEENPWIDNILNSNISGKEIKFTKEINDTTNYYLTSIKQPATLYPVIYTGQGFSNGFSEGFN